MNKYLVISLIVIVVLVGGFFALNSYVYNEKQATTADNYKDAEFIIEGERVQLVSEVRYFGNEFFTDLNDDGREDVVFLVTHEPGGSGTFFYVVAALNTEDGYIGSDGYLLGDRIAPQTIEESPNPRHVNVIVVNYADRAGGEPMTAQPSVGKSVYLKLDPAYMQWGIVEPDFEGESALPPESEPITVRGTMVCLPKRGSGAQTMECALGLQGQADDLYYALEDIPESGYIFQTGTEVEVSGIFREEEQLGPDGNPYDIVGVITITSIQQL